MSHFLLKRFMLMLPTAFGVLVLTFLLVHLVPGDPVEVLLGERALPADRDALREALGLNLPLLQQFWQFIAGVFTLDLGTSLYTKEPVSAMIAERIVPTALLALWAMCFALIVAFPLGIIAAAYKGKWQDKFAISVSLIGFSMPNFWFGPLLMILFGLWLDLLPISGMTDWSSFILPAVTLGLGMAAITSRLIRASLLEALSSDYIRTARAKGVRAQNLMVKHALKNALLPVVTVVFLQAGALLTGAILTEMIFSWPGIGSLLVEALNRRDYMVVQGTVLFIAFVYMLMTLLSDICYALVDPRIRYASEDR